MIRKESMLSGSGLVWEVDLLVIPQQTTFVKYSSKIWQNQTPQNMKINPSQVLILIANGKLLVKKGYHLDF